MVVTSEKLRYGIQGYYELLDAIEIIFPKPGSLGNNKYPLLLLPPFSFIFQPHGAPLTKWEAIGKEAGVGKKTEIKSL